MWYLQKKQWFIVLVLYSTDGRIFTTYDGSTRALPWGSLKNNENIYNAIQRIAKNIHAKIDIRDIQPLVSMDNTFCHKNTAYSMHGLVFTARLFNPKVVEETQYWDMFSLTPDFIDGVQKYGNKDILTYFHTNKLQKIIKQNISVFK